MAFISDFEPYFDDFDEEPVETDRNRQEEDLAQMHCPRCLERWWGHVHTKPTCPDCADKGIRSRLVETTKRGTKASS